MLARALFNTQGELLRGISGFGAPTLGPKSLDINRAMQRWAPDVRQRLYQFQLASALYMPYSAARQKSVTLWYRTTIGPQGGGLRARYAKLVTLRRPRYDDRGSQRPAPPGSPGGTLPVELQAVFDMIPLRPERKPEILAQVSPPYSFFASVLNLQAGRRRRTFELLTTANTFASVAGQQFKHAFRVLRPADRSSLIQPMIAKPGHGSPGRAQRRAGARHVLTRLLNLPRLRARSVSEAVARIVENRIVAGLHYCGQCARWFWGFLAWYFLNVRGAHAAAWLWNLAKAEQ